MGIENIRGNEVERFKVKAEKQHWVVMISIEGFESVMLMYGTQNEMWDYMRDSFKSSIRYRWRVASEEDVAMARKLGIKAYVC